MQAPVGEQRDDVGHTVQRQVPDLQKALHGRACGPLDDLRRVGQHDVPVEAVGGEVLVLEPSHLH
jgi:hypothetical protein